MTPSEPESRAPGGGTLVEAGGDGSLPNRDRWSLMWSATRAIVRARRAGSSLVPFRTEGSRTPLFFLPGRSGKVTAYGQYLTCFEDRPFYALEPKGMDGRDIPNSRVDDIATHFLAELRAVQPHGPYLLCGFCAGGAVAFEMAQQLNREGETVGALVLLDTWNPRHAKWRLAFRRLRRQLGQRPQAFEKVRYLLRWTGRGLRWALLHPLRKPYRKAGRPLPRFLQYASVSAATQDANDYRPGPYRGKIVLFHSRDLAPGPGVAPDLGWGEVAVGGVEIHHVAASHTDFTRDPEVIALVGGRIREVVEEAERRLATEAAAAR